MPAQNQVLIAITIEVFGNNGLSTKIQSNPDIQVPPNSIRARIPGVDLDVEDKNLRIYKPQYPKSCQDVKPGDLVYVMHENNNSLGRGIWIGRVKDASIHGPGDIYEKKLKNKWSEQVLLGYLNAGIATPESPIYENQWNAGSEIGTLPSIWPVSFENKKYEYLNNKNIRIYSSGLEKNVILAGGGIITGLTPTSILVSNGNIEGKNGSVVIMFYSNLVLNSYQLFNGISLGNYVNPGKLIGKINNYLEFGISINGINVDPIPFIVGNERGKRPNFNTISSSELYLSIITI